MKHLGQTYAKLMTTLQVSYENVKFAASDVIRKHSVRGCYWSNILSYK